ncbi:MAG TPA: hypothetical protein VF789_32100 [Thermoanaerobaculia bacterium]
MKSLSGPPEEFAARRLPSGPETAVRTNILLVDRGKRVANVGAASTTYSSFDTSPGVGFSLVQATNQYPYFAPSTITAPDGRIFQFDGWSITCTYGPCGDSQASLTMEAFPQTPGGTVVFSISGGEVKGGSWGLEVQDPVQPAPALSSAKNTEPLQVESLISFDDNVVEVEVDPDPCPEGMFCPVEEASKRRHAAFDLADGAAPVLRVSFSTRAMRRKGLRTGIEVTALTLTVTDARTRKVFHQKQLDPSGLKDLAVDKDGSNLVRLPALPVGEYSVRLDIRGKVKGVGPIQRTALYYLPIVARRYEMTEEVEVEAIDGERLKLMLGVESLTRRNKHVYAYAEVWSRDGQKPIAWIGGMTQPEQDSSGRLGLPILLDTRWLALAEESGPDYLLRNVRIQDPDTFIPIDQIAELPFTVWQLPKAASLAKAEVVKDDSLYMGKGDRTIIVAGDEPLPVVDKNHGAPIGILLVHGWCSNNVWPANEFFRGPTATFTDFGASRSHDAFALQIRNQGAAHFNTAFTVVAHSQGGAAATHLRAFYGSLLDSSTAPRRIQSVGTPYGGSTLMDYYLATGPLGWLIANIFGQCAPQFDLGTLGSALWRSNIPSWASNDVYYYRTGYQRARSFWEKLQFWRWRCNAASFVIPGWDDGVVADFQGTLSGAHDMGITEGECHTGGMNHVAQTLNAGRNAIMDREGRPTVPLVGVIRGAAGCGTMPEFDVFFDNEDNNNANNRGGWIGATQSGSNTLLRLCGAPETSFQAAAAQGARFAIVALANTCPAGFTRFDRFHDNEDNRTTSWDTTPTGSPTDTVGSAKNTNMAFCVATGSSTGVANSAFPNLGVSYGVFGGRTSTLSGWALDRGFIHMDDEDNNNQNQPGSPPAYTWEFLQAGGNTTYYMVRVR